MTTRFVYPVYSWKMNRLMINSDTEDGYVYGMEGNVRDSIDAYLEYSGLDIDRVRWLVKIGDDFEELFADSIDNFVEKFDKLDGVVWERIGRY